MEAVAEDAVEALAEEVVEAVAEEAVAAAKGGGARYGRGRW
jgi:hypothetical protein